MTRRVVETGWMVALLASVPVLSHAQAMAPAALAPVIVRALPLDDRAASAPFTGDATAAADVARTNSLSVLDALVQHTPGAFAADVNGNPYSQVLDLRGFTASPQQGQPQGLAVYLGGVRLNEAFGNTVNFDLVPAVAVEQADVLTGDPAYGLNALGGSLAFTMKTGKTYGGGSVTVEGGSFGRAGGSAQFGRRYGDWNLYAAAEGEREGGWRQRSPSSTTRLYGDLGRDIGDRLEAHLIGSASASILGVVGPTPVDLLAQDRTAVFTSPQTTRNDSALVALDLKWRGPAGWTVTGDLHGRVFNQAHVDGNDANVESCSSRTTNPLYGTLCLEDDAFPRTIRPAAAAFQILQPSGAPIACPGVAGGALSCAGIPYGTIDRTHTDSSTLGAAAQAGWEGELFGRKSRFAVGGAVDGSTFRFSSQSELGLIGPDLVVAPSAGVPGMGVPIHTAGLIGYAPLAIAGRRRDGGVYGAEVLDLTSALTLTVSGRWNTTDLRVTDRLGTSPDLNGSHSFTRFNPQAGIDWRLGSALTLHAAYSEGSRAPTALELSCADPARPCLLENALVADPPLSQVVSHTSELGLSGQSAFLGGRLQWRLTGFNTDVDDDIIALASQIQGRGYYANVPRTRRLGVELGANLHTGPFDAYLGYSHIEASYRFAGQLSARANPLADANDEISVRPGNAIGGVPQDRFKVGLDWRATTRLTVGGDLLAVGSQPFVGDENGSLPHLPGWASVNLHARWQVTPHLAAFAQVYNLLDERYSTYGAFFDAGGVQNAGSALPADPSPNTVTPAAPRSARVGFDYRW